MCIYVDKCERQTDAVFSVAMESKSVATDAFRSESVGLAMVRASQLFVTPVTSLCIRTATTTVIIIHLLRKGSDKQ